MIHLNTKLKIIIEIILEAFDFYYENYVNVEIIEYREGITRRLVSSGNESRGRNVGNVTEKVARYYWK